jgi:hypothetical protein
LTAGVAVSFLENSHYVEQFKEVIDKALRFVEREIDDLDDNYALAVSAYAFSLNKNEESAKKCFNKLMANAVKTKTETSWNDTNNDPIREIEIGAYAILTQVNFNKGLDAVNILNWLLFEVNKVGGFRNYKTFVALQAVTELAKKIHSDHVELDVFLNSKIKIPIDDLNAMNPQIATIPFSRGDEGVSVNLNGTGVALVNITQKFIMKKTQNNAEKFNIAVNPTKVGENMNLNICVNNKLQGRSREVIVEVLLPNGYEYNEISTDSLTRKGAKVKIKVLFQTLNTSNSN